MHMKVSLTSEMTQSCYSGHTVALLDDRSADDAGRDDRHRVQVGGIVRHDDPRRRTRHPPASATGGRRAELPVFVPTNNAHAPRSHAT
jgi:ribosome biogenesis SPOUT family RNA methylase Rps3